VKYNDHPHQTGCYEQLTNIMWSTLKHYEETT